MSGQECLDLQTKLDLSNKALLQGVAPAIRKSIGCDKIIQSGLGQFVRERSHMLDDFYHSSLEHFVVKTDKGEPVEWG